MYNKLELEFNKQYMKVLTELENYCKYILRCLHRINIYPAPSDFTLVAYQRPNNSIGEILIYPASAVTKEGIQNPMFAYGYYFEYDFKDLEHPYKTIFSENYEELIN